MPKAAAATGESLFQVKDLTAGVNLRPSPTNIKPNQASRLINTLITSVGELGVYPGWTLKSASNLGSRRAQGGKRIYLAGTSFTLAADNGNVYQPDDATFTWGSAVLTGLSSTNIIEFVQDPFIAAVFDGASVPKYTANGTTWYQLGITAPLVPGLALAAGGSLVASDVHEVTYTYLNTTLNQESNESPVATATPSGGNLSITVTYAASSDAQVSKIRIYARDLTAGEASRRLVTTVNNASSTYTITADNWSAANASPPIGQNSVALPLAFGTYWLNRWWGRDATVGNRLRFTQVFQNLAWPDTFFVDIPFPKGESIQAMIPLGSILVLFGTTMFYLLLGSTSLSFQVLPALGTQTGAFGPRSVAAMDNNIVHAANPGVFLYNGASDTLLSLSIDPAWRAMIATSTAAELSVLPLIYETFVKELHVAVPYLFPVGNRGEWVLDMNRTQAPLPLQYGETPFSAWFATDRTIGGYLLWDGFEPITANQGRIFSWSPTTVQLYEERTGTSANGSDLTMQYLGYMVPFGLDTARITATYLEYLPAPETTFSVDLIVDGVHQGPIVYPITSAALSLYGVAKYGVNHYGGAATRATLPITWPLTAEGHTAQFGFTYVGQGQPKFFTYGTAAVVEDLPRGL